MLNFCKLQLNRHVQHIMCLEKFKLKIVVAFKGNLTFYMLYQGRSELI